MEIKLSDKFTTGRLLRFILPSVCMMVFISIYGVVDGLFVSNFAGKTQFAALNLIMPALMLPGTLGFMMGTGGSALVAKTLGQGERERANSYFSLMIYTTLIGGIALAIPMIIFIKPIAVLLGADETMVNYCADYGRIILLALPAFMLQNAFQSFLATAQKPKLGLLCTVIAGCTNIALDALFVGLFRWSLQGAAAATVISQLVGGIVPFIYFVRENDSLLRLGKTRFYGRALFQASTNGLSELMTNVSMSLVNMVYNYRLMEMLGEDGVAAYGVIMYVNFIFISIFIGYSVGSAPIIGYNYGAQNRTELQGLLKKSLAIVGIAGLSLTALAELLAYPLTMLFAGYDADFFALTLHAFRLYSLQFLLCGFNIFASSFFTALNNGPVSAAISFLRTLVFQLAALLILPEFIGSDGIWLAIGTAELCSLAVSAAFIIGKRKKYGYFPTAEKAPL